MYFCHAQSLTETVWKEQHLTSEGKVGPEAVKIWKMTVKCTSCIWAVSSFFEVDPSDTVVAKAVQVFTTTKFPLSAYQYHFFKKQRLN